MLASVELPFDDPDLAGMTVADVLDDPARFVGETLADPIEGVEDGRCKAKVMWDGVGPPFINSFAHGHAVYRLRYDAAAVQARIARAAADDVVAALVRLVAMADLSAVEIMRWSHDVAKRAGRRCARRQVDVEGGLGCATGATGRGRARAEDGNDAAIRARCRIGRLSMPSGCRCSARSTRSPVRSNACAGHGVTSTARWRASAGCRLHRPTPSPPPTTKEMMHDQPASP